MLPVAKGFFRAEVIVRYLPRMSKMNEPLMPGKIIAQMAIEPDKKSMGNVSGVDTGISETTAYPIAVPIKREIILCQDLSFGICFETKSTEAMIRPKNKDQV